MGSAQASATLNVDGGSVFVPFATRAIVNASPAAGSSPTVVVQAATSISVVGSGAIVSLTGQSNSITVVGGSLTVSGTGNVVTLAGGRAEVSGVRNQLAVVTGTATFVGTSGSVRAGNLGTIFLTGTSALADVSGSRGEPNQNFQTLDLAGFVRIIRLMSKALLVATGVSLTVRAVSGDASVLGTGHTITAQISGTAYVSQSITILHCLTLGERGSKHCHHRPGRNREYR